MRALIQRVQSASVKIENKPGASIDHGILVFLGIEETDTNDDIEWMSGKIVRLRIFRDDKNVMNLSLLDIGGEVLLISQFTLHASTKKGNRPSYIRAARPDIAIPLYEQFIDRIELDMGKSIKTGEFGAYMQVELVNDGPVTIMLDSKNRE